MKKLNKKRKTFNYDIITNRRLLVLIFVVGFDTLINIIYNERLENVPKILETPYVDKDYPPYKVEIEMIRNKTMYDDLLDRIKQA